MAINKTGVPDANEVNIGRGALLFAEVNSAGKPQGYRHLGNATAFNVNFETETLPHESSREGIKTADLELIVSQRFGISFSLDHINFDNLGLAFAGEAVDVNSAVPTVNAAKSSMTDVLQVDSVSKGRWVYLANASGVRHYDIVAGNLTVKTESGGGGTPGSTLVLNTDYILDTKMGGVFLLSTGSTHVNGKQLYASYTADATAKDIEQVRSLTKSQIKGALKFIAQNPANGDKQREYEFHQVTLQPEGDLELIGDEFTEIQLSGSAGTNAMFTRPVTITDHADS